MAVKVGDFSRWVRREARRMAQAGTGIAYFLGIAGDARRATMVSLSSLVSRRDRTRCSGEPVLRAEVTRGQERTGRKGKGGRAMTRPTKGVCNGMRLAAAGMVFLAGCTALTTQVLVDEKGRPRPAGTVHCSGSEWTDNSLIAVV